MEDESALTAPVFKKRAKSSFKRKHDSSSADDETETSSQHLSVSEILRQRRQGKIRRSAMEASTHEQDDHSRAVAAVASNKEKSDVDKMRNRFVVQTGQVAGLYDKQMNEYIDAKLAEYRNQTGDIPRTHSAPNHGPHLPASTTVETTTNNGPPKPDKLSVAAGKLMEVDLSNSLSKHEEETAAKAAKPAKVRLGRDGKPWRPRKRRNSEDLARDALIDSIMKENSLSRFQDAAPSAATTSDAAAGKSNNEYIDEDRVLENFKSNYQDPERRNVRKPATANKQDHAKGPKMGGSKNARRAAAAEESAKGRKA